MRLIDADKLKAHYSWWDNEEKKVFDDIVDLQPTADRPKGKWVYLTNKEVSEKDPIFSTFYARDSWLNYECSCCGHMVHNEFKGTHDDRTKFCPNCGADMR